MRPNSVRAACALIAIGLVLGGCGSESAATTTAEPAVDLNTLEVGNYPTEPRDYGTAKNLDQARIVEAERLANFVPTPREIDQRFAYAPHFSSKIFFDPKTSDLHWAIKLDEFDAVAPDFITGFVSFGSSAEDNRGTDLMNVVMEFPDEQKAADAAIALERSDFEAAAAANQPVTIPRYPAAKAHWRPSQQSIGSFFATGKMVVYTWVYDYRKIFLDEQDLPALVALVTQSLDKAVPALGEFAPTPPAQLMSAQLDLDGMLGRTLPRLDADFNLNPPGAYHARGTEHFSSAPAQDVPKFQAVGVDRFAVDSAEVYRTADAAGARQLRDELVGPSRKFRSAPAPKNLPQARCQEYLGRDKSVIRFYCAVAFDRYTGYTWSDQLNDVQQRISAQYALLVNVK
ncbi:hypothetical protein [Nocardia sp. NPDC005998]|uniref:DUF7373 family lipoprotein n=1 Tax=Nocardia sp. NPDC005998 TaxID=3156894 RepID=UPI0033B2CA9E